MPCPYVELNCQRLKREEESWKGMSEQDKSYFDRNPVETLKSALCSSESEFDKCVEYLRRSES